MLLHVSSTVVLIIRRSKLYYTASGIITPVGGRPVHRLREDCARANMHFSCQVDILDQKNIITTIHIFIVLVINQHNVQILLL